MQSKALLICVPKRKSDDATRIACLATLATGLVFKVEEIEKIHSMFKELNDDEIEFHVYTLNYIYNYFVVFDRAVSEC